MHSTIRGDYDTLPQDTFKELYAQAQASGGETQIEYMGSMQFDLTDLMRQVMLRYGKLKEQDGYDMEFIADGEVYIMGDADKIAQVLCNLINNAINYTGADKKIIVRQSLHEHHVRVDVIDSGEGIAAQDIPYVWDGIIREIRRENAWCQAQVWDFPLCKRFWNCTERPMV